MTIHYPKILILKLILILFMLHDLHAQIAPSNLRLISRNPAYSSSLHKLRALRLTYVYEWNDMYVYKKQHKSASLTDFLSEETFDVCYCRRTSAF